LTNANIALIWLHELMHRPHSLTKPSVSLPTEQLVSLIVQQQQTIERLQQEIERLKVSLQLDSQNSSKPPSSDSTQET